jgi:hypothetical protein
MVSLLYVTYNLFFLTVVDVSDESDENSENDDSEESEEGFRFNADKTKLLLAAYKKFQDKILSGRQKKKTIWAKVRMICIPFTLLVKLTRL